MAPLSTEDVAGLIGISRVTLERWLAARKIPLPGMLKIGRREFRNWKVSDIERLKRFKAKYYRKGRGRKKRSK